jgi:antitoxin VapB
VVLSLPYSVQDERGGSQSGAPAWGKREPSRTGGDFGSADWFFLVGLGFMVEWWKDMVERWKAMALNIKNEETNRMVRELAALKGISLVVAVTEAVREKLEKEKAERERGNGKKGLAAWLMEISRETAPLMNDGRTSKEVMDELYDDETGLPK